MILTAIPTVTGIVRIRFTNPVEREGNSPDMRWIRSVEVDHMTGDRLHCEFQNLYASTREALLLPHELEADAAIKRIADAAAEARGCE